MRELELRLQQENPIFRRIWVQYSHKGSYRVIITLFPQGHGIYQMAFGEVQTLSYELINSVLQNYLEKSK